MGEEALAPLGPDATAASAPPFEQAAGTLRRPGAEAAAVPPDAEAAAVPPPAPPSFSDEPPVRWPTAAEVAPAPVYGNRPWGLVDPGPVSDGKWLSRGYASSSGRATVLRLLLALQVAFDVGLILFDRGLVFAVDSGVRFSAGQASLLRGVLHATGPVSIGIAVVLLVGIFAWISRVVENVPALTGRTPERSPRESIGWWFVPVASWWVPYTIVRDAAWRLRVTADDPAVRLVLPWWILRVGAGIAGLVFGRLLHVDAATTQLLSQAVLVAEALGDVLMILVVASIARSERTQAARLDFGAGRGHHWPEFASPPPDDTPAYGLAEGLGDEPFVDWRRRLGTRHAAARPDDPLAQTPDERDDDYDERLLAALEAEAVQR